jgi:hypothetical protein
MAEWRALLSRAMDHLHGIGLDRKDWRLGGGTVLMLRYSHRVSRDIDIFLNDVQYLSFLSPRLNDATRGGTERYSEAANSLRLFYPEGEIDFLAVAPVFPRLAPESMKLEGIEEAFFALPDIEILAQKLHYRSWGFTGRDLYDFAAVTHFRPELLDDADLRRVASGRAAALRASLEAPACRAGFEQIVEPALKIGFDEAKGVLVEWIGGA